MELENSWKQINLGKSATLKARIGWQGLTTAEYLSSGDYYLVTGTDFLNGFIDWDNCVHVEKERYDQDKYIQLQVNDILVTKDGTIGKVAIVDKIVKPTTLNSGVFVIRPIGKSFYPNYLYYILRSGHFADFLSKLTAGSTINHLYQKDFVHYVFPAPPTLEEQKLIADTLSDTDVLIQNLKTLITKKKAIKQGAMQELLTGKRRLKGFSGEWEEKTLGDLVQFKNGKAHENSVVEYGDYVIINSKFVSTEGRVRKYSQDCFCPVDKEEILMVLSDVPNGKAIAKCFFVDKNNTYTLNQRICSLKAKNDNPKFLFHIINRNKYFLTFDDGVKQTNLRNEDVLACPISLPKNIKEQDEIVKIITDMSSELEALEIQLQKTENLKQGMMQELLTGKIRLVKTVSKSTKKDLLTNVKAKNRVKI